MRQTVKIHVLLDVTLNIPPPPPPIILAKMQLRASKTEDYLALTGKQNLADIATLQQALTILRDEINADAKDDEASPAFKKSLTVSLFYRVSQCKNFNKQNQSNNVKENFSFLSNDSTFIIVYFCCYSRLFWSWWVIWPTRVTDRPSADWCVHWVPPRSPIKRSRIGIPWQRTCPSWSPCCNAPARPSTLPTLRVRACCMRRSRPVSRETQPSTPLTKRLLW